MEKSWRREITPASQAKQRFSFPTPFPILGASESLSREKRVMGLDLVDHGRFVVEFLERERGGRRGERD